MQMKQKHFTSLDCYRGLTYHCTHRISHCTHRISDANRQALWPPPHCPPKQRRDQDIIIDFSSLGYQIPQLSDPTGMLFIFIAHDRCSHCLTEVLYTFHTMIAQYAAGWGIAKMCLCTTKHRVAPGAKRELRTCRTIGAALPFGQSFGPEHRRISTITNLNSWACFDVIDVIPLHQNKLPRFIL